MFTAMTLGIVDYEQSNKTPGTDPGWSTAKRLIDIRPNIREQ